MYFPLLFVFLVSSSSLFSIFHALKLHHSVLLSTLPPSSSRSPIVILHGLLGSARNFNSFAKTLHQKLGHCHDIIAMDLRAHGRTSSSSSPGIVLDYSAMAKDVFETLEYLRINKVHIIGHSMGGKVASMLALTYPQIVQSLAVIDISPVPYEATDFHMVSNLILKLKEMAIEQQLLKDRNNANTYLSSREIDANMIPFLLSNLVLGETGYMEWKFDLNVIVDSLQNVINFEPQPSSPPYQGPLLLIKAGSSNFILSKHLSAIQALFSKYSLVSIRDCGHWVHAEKPEDLANILCKFVTTF